MLILLGIITIITLLGRYALAQGRKIEQNKKFKKNLKNFDNKSVKMPGKNGPRGWHN
jgi:hypothetical protein